jgi:hypothetical protein
VLGRVLRDVAPGHRVGECLVQHHVHIAHGLRRQPTVTLDSAPGEQVLVERVESPSRQVMLQPNGTDDGDDVSAGVVLVAGVGARPEHMPNRREPLVDEELTEATTRGPHEMTGASAAVIASRQARHASFSVANPPLLAANAVVGPSSDMRRGSNSCRVALG